MCLASSLRNTQLFEEIHNLQIELVSGIDVAGDEGNFPNECVESAVRTGVASGMQLTMHSGETGSYENVLTAIALGATQESEWCSDQKESKVYGSRQRKEYLA